MRRSRSPWSLFLALLLSAAAPVSAQDPKPKEKPMAPDVVAPQKGPRAADAQESIVILHTNMGNITLGFYPDRAPNHVANFLDLVRTGFYDGTLFHRVIPGFMIQGGDPVSKDDDPTNDGTGDGPRMLKAEFNSIPHTRGILSMARRPGLPDSASCQFFIMLRDNHKLDGQYTVFGHVLDGMEVVDKIASVPRAENDRPLQNVVIRRGEVRKR